MFKIHTVDGGRNPAHEALPCSAITPKAGMALTMTDGKLAVASGTSKPLYISMEEHAAAVTAGDEVSVIRVLPDTIFETEFSVAATSIKPGDKVTLSTDGLAVTATTTGGVAEVVSMSGAAAGDAVRVRFA